MSPLLRSGLATNQEVICSHSPSKGSLWVRRQPSTRFRRSCSRYKDSSPAAGSGMFSSTGNVPAVHCSTEKTRRGAEGRDEIKGKQPAAQRKMACCNCSSTASQKFLSRLVQSQETIANGGSNGLLPKGEITCRLFFLLLHQGKEAST